MPPQNAQKRDSVFEPLGFSATIEACHEEIRELYLADPIPWVIGYSGGKDSTAVLQLVWSAVAKLKPEQRTKPIHVISTDTLVENPIVAAWVNRSLEAMKRTAASTNMPVRPNRLTPGIRDTFWVNLVGRGYPAPRHKFRWCTLRLKINPSNSFILNVVRDNGEAILVLGTRKAESQARARNMAEHEKHAVRDRLAPNANLRNCLVYTPIESWSNDDVWTYLMQVSNPWGHDNKDLLTMYRGASPDGECPLVVDSTTPSCGSSRFGCWVCTLVDEDKSMAAMVQNDEEKEWMLPLLELRNEFEFRTDETRQRERERRDFRRISGDLTFYTNSQGESQLVHGPYKQEARIYWLRRLLQVQKYIRENGPTYVRDFELVSPAELHEIRRIWVVDKHEIEDFLPRLYEEEMGTPYPGPALDDGLMFDKEALSLLRNTCNGDELHFELIRTLLDLERRYRTMASRRGLFPALETAVTKCFYDDEQDALARARERHAIDNPIEAEDEGAEVVTALGDKEDGVRNDDAVLSLPLFAKADHHKAKSIPARRVVGQ